MHAQGELLAKAERRGRKLLLPQITNKTGQNSSRMIISEFWKLTKYKQEIENYSWKPELELWRRMERVCGILHKKQTNKRTNKPWGGYYYPYCLGWGWKENWVTGYDTLLHYYSHFRDWKTRTELQRGWGMAKSHSQKKAEPEFKLSMRSNRFYEVLSRNFCIVWMLTFGSGKIIDVGTNGFILVPVASNTS